LVIKLGTSHRSHVTVQHEIDRFSGFLHWRFHRSLQKKVQKKVEITDKETRYSFQVQKHTSEILKCGVHCIQSDKGVTMVLELDAQLL
jgi:hypothetical protein